MRVDSILQAPVYDKKLVYLDCHTLPSKELLAVHSTIRMYHRKCSAFRLSYAFIGVTFRAVVVLFNKSSELEFFSLQQNCKQLTLYTRISISYNYMYIPRDQSQKTKCLGVLFYYCDELAILFIVHFL